MSKSKGNNRNNKSTARKVENNCQNRSKVSGKASQPSTKAVNHPVPGKGDKK